MGRSTARAVTLLISGVLLSGIGGCADTSVDERPGLWTLFDIRDALNAGTPVAVTPRYPTGINPLEILTPAADGTATLSVLPAFSEGQPAAYVMPEVWAHFDEVWIQPWYVLLTAWDGKSPNQNRAKTSDGVNAPPVFDVGPRSLFYSPLWLRYYAVLPEGADAGEYTSAERIFDEQLAVYPNVAWTYSVRPPDVRLPAAPIVHPYLQTPVASFLTEASTSWVDDESIAYFDEGSANFTFRWEGLVVDEVPLYELARRGPDGAPLALGAPRVMGSGPPFARRPADAPNGRPRFGAYSRIYFAVAPATAAAFDPDAYPDAAALLTAQGLNPQSYRGRVATNGMKVSDTDVACFAATDFPASCTWLDSQARIEDSLGTVNILPTEVTACSPLVFYAGKGIGGR
jgi:hypothetical protein